MIEAIKVKGANGFSQNTCTKQHNKYKTCQWGSSVVSRKSDKFALLTSLSVMLPDV